MGKRTRITRVYINEKIVDGKPCACSSATAATTRREGVLAKLSHGFAYVHFRHKLGVTIKVPADVVFRLEENA